MKHKFSKKNNFILFFLIALLSIFINFGSIVLFDFDTYFIGRISIIIGILFIILAIKEDTKNIYLEKEMLQKNYEPDPIKRMLNEKEEVSKSTKTTQCSKKT